MTEFDLIDLIVAELGSAARGADVRLGPGDDGAVVAPPAGSWVVSSIDVLLPDVHFPAAAAGDLVGYRALAVAASDLAAMGARPGYALVGLTLPAPPQEAWVQALARGFAAAATHFGLPVTGGNITRGPLNIAVSVHGWVAADQALRRDGARIGDRVFVTGRLGGAAQALRSSALDTVKDLSDLLEGTNVSAYYRPKLAFKEAEMLAGVATSSIDVSDGLLADAAHLAECSGVRMVLDAAALPLADAATLEDALAGDDYELCFTAPALPTGLEATAIGRVVAGEGVTLEGVSAEHALPTGFKHF